MTNHTTPTQQQRNRKYYLAHREELRLKAIQRYHQKHPNATYRDEDDTPTEELDDGDTSIKKIMPIKLVTITNAKTKPAGVSDVRWRIELNRRKMIKQYGKQEFELLCDHPQWNAKQ